MACVLCNAPITNAPREKRKSRHHDELAEQDALGYDHEHQVLHTGRLERGRITPIVSCEKRPPFRQQKVHIVKTTLNADRTAELRPETLSLRRGDCRLCGWAPQLDIGFVTAIVS